MKLLIKFCAVLCFIFTSCKNDTTANKAAEIKKEIPAFTSFGDAVSAEKVLTSEEMLATFNTMKSGDTIQVKFASSINEVCSKKGCWMKLPLSTDTETMVRFKNYGFFMPLDAKGKEVIVEGKAFVKETSVKELQHYAEDAGKTKEEIAKIIAPKKEFAFVANGVLLEVK
jgi:hypothetical protein